MVLKVLSNDCASCGKNKTQLAILHKATWNRGDVELQSVNIRNHRDAREEYDRVRAKLTDKRGDLDAIVVSDEGSAFWLKDVTEELMRTILA